MRRSERFAMTSWWNRTEVPRGRGASAAVNTQRGYAPQPAIQAPLDPRSHIHYLSLNGLDVRQSQRCLPAGPISSTVASGCGPALALRRRPPALA